MKISYDKSADALSFLFKRDKIVKDIQFAKNVFAGLTKDGDLVEIQVLEVSKQDSHWFTLEAAAKYLGKSERTLLRWIKAGRLKSKKYGREYHILPEELEKFAG